MIRNTERFTGKGGDYVAARPAYAQDMLAWLAQKGVGVGARVADIGAGTGKFTAQLLGLGATVWAVEPNADMRAKAEAVLSGNPRCTLVAATAESTTLADGSVDFVTAAQAFHWFDAAAFARECARILTPQGRVCLVWNNRVADAPIHRETAELSRAFCPTFVGFSNGQSEETLKTVAWFAEGFELCRFANDLTYDREGFVRRQLSSSYAPLPDTPAYAAYAAVMGELFDRYAQNGVLVAPNETVAWFGRPNV